VASNLLVLEGHVFKGPTRTQSPSGIPHCHFVLEHQSQQFEADLPRRAFLRLRVVVSGNAAQQITNDLFQGCHITVSGFLTRHESRNGTDKMVLHAQKIERMN
jgi:primosomal replication protein N